MTARTWGVNNNPIISLSSQSPESLSLEAGACHLKEAGACHLKEVPYDPVSQKGSSGMVVVLCSPLLHLYPSPLHLLTNSGARRVLLLKFLKGGKASYALAL